MDIAVNKNSLVTINSRFMLSCLVIFILIGCALFIPEWIYMKNRQIDYPVHLGFFSKLLKIGSMAFFVPPLFLAFNKLMRLQRATWVKVPMIIALLCLAVMIHLVLNEFLQSLVGFRPPNRSLWQLVSYASGRGLDTQFLSFLIPVFGVYGLSRFNRSKLDAPSPAKTVEGFHVKRRGEQVWLPCGQIAYLEADGNYLKLFGPEGKFEIIRQSLTSLEKELPAHFVRIHRSYAVNLDFVEGVFAEHKLRLKGGEQLNISRSKYKAVRKLWQERMESAATTRIK